MYVEAFHRTLKYNYLGGKYNKRVDTLLLNLVKFSRDKQFQRAIKLTKGKPSHRMRRLHKNHLSSLSPKTSAVSKTEEEGSYCISSEETKRNYFCKIISTVCHVENCQMKCIECGVCCHCYHCTCPDFLLNNVCCKHIHLLRRYQQENSLSESSFENQQHSPQSPSLCPTIIPETPPKVISTPTKSSYKEKEVAAITRNLTNPAKESNLDSLKKDVKRNLHILLQRVENCSDLDASAVHYLSKETTSAIHTFDALCKFKYTETLRPVKIIPSNKTVERQRNFFSTKKKRKAKENVRFQKPSFREKDKIFTKAAGKPNVQISKGIKTYFL